VIPGLNRPLFLLGLLLVLPLLYMFRNRAEREKRAVIAVHIVVVSVLSLAAAQPFVPTETQIYEEPTVTVLEDSSRSTQALRSSELGLEGVEVETVSIASGNASDIESALKRNLEPDSAYLLDSDLQTPADLGEVFTRYRRQNSTLGLLRHGTRPEASVSIEGPRDTVPEAENTYSVAVESTRQVPEPTLRVDGEEVSLTESDNSTWQYTTEFDSVGDHTLKASIPGQDTVEANNEFHMTVDVKQKPRVAVVGDTGALEERMDKFFSFENSQSLPEDLSDYDAVLAKKRLEGDLTEYVAGGNGYVRTGDIAESRDILPVRPEGEVDDESTRVMLAIDISASAGENEVLSSLKVAKALLVSLPASTRVGILGYNDEVLLVSEPKPLFAARSNLVDRLESRLPRSGSGQSLHYKGIQASEEVLNGTGNVVMISDGNIPSATISFGDNTRQGSLGPRIRRESKEAADDLGPKLLTVGVGDGTNDDFLRELASRAGGFYSSSDSTGRLQFVFSGGGGAGSNQGLVVTDPDQFIADGISLRSTTGSFDPVETKFGSRRVVSSSSGNPVLTVWRYGLGRSAVFTAGSKDLSRIVKTDPELVSRTLSWSVGDYGTDEGVRVEDARRPEAPTATSTSKVEDLKRQGPETYSLELEAPKPGFHEFRDDTYAYTYNREVQGAGYDTENLEELRSSGFKTYSVNQTSEIKEGLRQFSQRTETEKRELATPLVFAALVLLLLEIAYRKLNGME
jgi:hypothetical protein